MPQPPTSQSGSGSVHVRGPILIVDDDAEFAAFLTDTIGTWKLPNTINVFPDGRALMDFLSAGAVAKSGSADYPALIILDLKMPGMTGIDVMHRLKEAGHSEVPVIIVSGSQDFRSIAETYVMGAYSFISKPQRPGDLDKIKHALRIWN